jgi:hypothetical protein
MPLATWMYCKMTAPCTAHSIAASSCQPCEARTVALTIAIFRKEKKNQRQAMKTLQRAFMISRVEAWKTGQATFQTSSFSQQISRWKILKFSALRRQADACLLPLLHRSESAEFLGERSEVRNESILEPEPASVDCTWFTLLYALRADLEARSIRKSAHNASS